MHRAEISYSQFWADTHTFQMEHSIPFHSICSILKVQKLFEKCRNIENSEAYFAFLCVLLRARFPFSYLSLQTLFPKLPSSCL